MLKKFRAREVPACIDLRLGSEPFELPDELIYSVRGSRRIGVDISGN